MKSVIKAMHGEYNLIIKFSGMCACTYDALFDLKSIKGNPNSRRLLVFIYHMAEMFENICNNRPSPSVIAIWGLTAIMERKKSEEEEYKGVLEAKLRLSCHLPFPSPCPRPPSPPHPTPATCPALNNCTRSRFHNNSYSKRVFIHLSWWCQLHHHIYELFSSFIIKCHHCIQ